MYYFIIINKLIFEQAIVNGDSGSGVCTGFAGSERESVERTSEGSAQQRAESVQAAGSAAGRAPRPGGGGARGRRSAAAAGRSAARRPGHLFLYFATRLQELRVEPSPTRSPLSYSEKKERINPEIIVYLKSIRGSSRRT